ncbi:hypothetical protein PQR14_26145 [Paraburkholderia bryophila]|uniref:hypothetical protein n=1 Tax=Burkholderiaceae TaxID=119060 RepID=UPI0012E016E8|nr:MULTISPECIES: hypothetical protein [Burkholderiaceae]
MIDHVNIGFCPSIHELTASEIAVVSGGMEQQDQPNQDAGGVSGIVYAIASGAFYGGITGALTGAYSGLNWAHSGIGGMITGGVVGGMKKIGGGG